MGVEQHEIVVVGGGIAGLYCSYHLARAGKKVVLYEASRRLGGRIETWKIDKELFAEFGPMRIAPERQPLLKQLLLELGIREHTDQKTKPKRGELVPFPEYRSEEPVEPKFNLKEEESRQKTILDLLKLGLRQILKHNEHIKWNREARPHFESMTSDVGEIKRHWKREMNGWLNLLNDRDFAKLRRFGRTNGISLWNIGFWNALSDELSHMAVMKIRDWGNFYHLLPENPNAAEWIVFWLRALQTSQHLRGIEGGMSQIVTRLVDRFENPKLKGLIQVETGMKLVRLEPCAKRRVELVFEKAAMKQFSRVEASHVILALPKRPLEHLGDCLKAVQDDLNAVIGFPLLKCFFVVNKPWWEKDRKPQSYASRAPTRELYWSTREDRKKGMVMVYTDRPATQFWADYLPRSNTQWEAKKWTKKRKNPRLERKFLQYLRENEMREFKIENLVKYGMRDWSREPYGAAAHAWRSGYKSWEVIERLKAFSLTKSGSRNVHICGEAYSDYQGFIEGALRSATKVLDLFGVTRS